MAARVRRPCPSCGVPALTGAGYCPRCGSPLIVASPEGSWSVRVEPIPSMQMRRDVASWLDRHMTVENPDVLAQTLGQGQTVLGGDLTRPAAQALADALRAQRVAASMTQDVPRAPSFGQAALSLKAQGPALAAAALLALIPVLGWIMMVPVYLGLMLGLAWWSSQQKVKVGATAPLDLDQLDGWPTAGPQLKAALEVLPLGARADLSRVAVAVAEVQSELRSESLVAFAAGVTDDRLAEATRLMLDRGLAAASAVQAGDARAAKRLHALADAAESALERLQALEAEIGQGAQTRETLDALEAAIEQAQQVAAEVPAVAVAR